MYIALLIALAAIGYRVVFVTGMMVIHAQGFDALACMRDTPKFLDWLSAFSSGKFTSIEPWNGRSMPGYPLMAAPLTLLLPPFWALWVVTFGGAVGSVVLSTRLFGRRVGWYMAMCIPAWLYYSSIAMSESLLAFFCLVAVWAYRSDRPYLAAVFLGCAIVTKVTAIWLAFPLLMGLVARKGLRSSSGLAGILMSFSLGYLMFIEIIFGSPFYSLNIQRSVYALHGWPLLDWPFHALVQGLADPSYALMKKIYVLAHLVPILVAVTVGLARLKTATEPLWLLCTIWTTLTLLFASCVGGGYGWGGFPRWLIPVYPPALYLLFRMVPQSKILDILICTLSIVGAALLWKGA